MSDEKQKAPVTGKGSPAGMRWFVTRFPGYCQEVVAEKVLDENGNKRPYLRIAFKSEAKSNLMVGHGHLGTDNKGGSDTNANKKYGLLAIADPGPGPFNKDDVDTDENGWTKGDRRKIINTLRMTSHFRCTPQDNEFRVTSRLVELNWDPAEIRTHEASMVVAGSSRPMSRPIAGSPEDTAPEPPKKPVGSQMGRRTIPA